MSLDLRLILGNGQKHLRHSVTYVILHDILYEKHRDKHTDSRVYQIKEIVHLTVEPSGQAMMNIQDRQFKGNSCNTTRHSYEQSEDNHNIPLRQPAEEPSDR